MIRQPPFGDARLEPPHTPAKAEVGVIVPTRNRPARLRRCLEALAGARAEMPFDVFVCDSSESENAPEVERICREHAFVRLVRHTGDGASAARNVGTRACNTKLVVNVDDDVYVDPGAISALVRRYRAAKGEVVVAGTVRWQHWASRPLVMKRIGHGRAALQGESPEFLVSALLLYPRALALALPWNERLWPYDDRYVSLVWKAAGARLDFAADALATHDERHTQYPVAHEADRIYVNLLDAAVVNPSIARLLQFEILGFAANARAWARTPGGLTGLIGAWFAGHRAFIEDLRDLRAVREVARRHRGVPDDQRDGP
jgi:glycosyltransferase involved in cell wall biosynthesis